MKLILFISKVFLFSLLVLPQLVVAQQPPEAKRMDIFVGNWEYVDAGGGFSCKWLGDLIIHCEGTWKSDDGDTNEIVWLNKYDAEANIFTTSRFYSGGYTDSGFGWLDGDTSTFVYEGPGGARYRLKNVISEDTWTWEW